MQVRDLIMIRENSTFNFITAIEKRLRYFYTNTRLESNKLGDLSLYTPKSISIYMVSR